MGFQLDVCPDLSCHELAEPRREREGGDNQRHNARVNQPTRENKQTNKQEKQKHSVSTKL